MAENTENQPRRDDVLRLAIESSTAVKTARAYLCGKSRSSGVTLDRLQKAAKKLGLKGGGAK